MGPFVGGMRPAVIVVAALLATSVRAKPSSDLEIKPGPSAMSAAEAAIVADPSAGSQHGVILVEETLRNENLGSTSLIQPPHAGEDPLRRGRSLADVEIPGLRSDSDLKTWWGKTILPDGTVLELKEEDLKRQSILKQGSRQIRTVKRRSLASCPAASSTSVTSCTGTATSRSSAWFCKNSGR